MTTPLLIGISHFLCLFVGDGSHVVQASLELMVSPPSPLGAGITGMNHWDQLGFHILIKLKINSSDEDYFHKIGLAHNLKKYDLWVFQEEFYFYSDDTQ